MNAVAPSLTNTDMGNNRKQKDLDRFVAHTALKRMAQPEEIATAVDVYKRQVLSYPLANSSDREELCFYIFLFRLPGISISSGLLSTDYLP